MSKGLSRSIGAVSIIIQISIVVMYFNFITPFVYLYRGFTNTAVSNMINDHDNFLIVSGHTTVSHSAISNFPNLIYAILMAVGIALGTLGAIYMWSSMVKICSNLGGKKYFVPENLAMLKRIVIGEVMTVCSDPLIAAANQMSKSLLGRVNVGLFSNTWETFGDDIIYLVFIALIYTLFKMAMNIKQENELTV
ncbi:DUF2975 domain-containing protein [Lentilactobacillus otakiensis]|uniref:DUF2975 domain-containing protein n=1 Tax=Lentilactobacillus otakiensis TaxID=481720 RepID=UPI003D17E1B0